MRPCTFRPAKSLQSELSARFATLLILAALQPIYLRASENDLSNLSSAPDGQAGREVRRQSPDVLVHALAIAFSQGQDKKTKEILAQILKRPQLDPDLLMAVGAEFAQHDQYAEAALAFSRCARDHPAMFEAHYNLALAEFAEGRLAEALAALDAAPHNSAEEIALWYLRGKIEYGLGKIVEAESYLTAAFRGAPQLENYALDLGLLYLRQHAYAQAAKVFERGASLNPKSPFLFLGLSLAQFLGGSTAQSLESAEKLLKIQPDFTPAFLIAAFVLELSGRLDEAERLAARGLALPHPTAYLYYLHAAILVKLQSKEHGQILKELAMASHEIPACGLCYLTASKVHQTQGDSQAAIAELQRAVRIAPDLADAWYRLSALYERLGRKADAAQARESFEKLKADKEDRETVMLRKVFLQTLSGEERPATSP